jgi:hypothetical protein
MFTLQQHSFIVLHSVANDRKDTAGANREWLGWRLSDGERATLAEIGRRLGRKGLQQVARIAKPDTILAWYRQRIAEKFDGCKRRRTPGRPRTSPEIEDLVVRLAREDSGWGYDRMVGALANLGHQVSDQTVGNILRRHGIGPVPQRSQTTTWKDFIRRHMDVLAGIDFFTVEVLTWRGLVTYYVLFFIHLESRRVSIAGVTDHPDGLQRDIGGYGRSERLWLRFARSRCQVLRCLPRELGSRGREVYRTSSPQPELERFCGALGAVGQRGVHIPLDPDRGSFVAESAHPVPRA